MNSACAVPASVAAPADTLPAERWIVFFGEDWGGHNSTGQYLAAGLAERHRVLWVDSLGLRSPRLCLHDLRRVRAKLSAFLRSLRAGTTPPAGLPPGLAVVSPLALPWPGRRWVRRLNRRLVGAYLRRAARRHGIVHPFVITACPATVDVLDVLAPQRVVYYCADEHAVFPGMDAALVGRIEGELLARVDRVVACSRALVRAKGRLHGDVHYLPHGVNLAHMRGALAAPPRPAPLVGVDGPIVGFVGQIADHVDLALLAAAADALPRVTFAMVGPVVEGTSLPAAANLLYVGARPYAELPAWLACFDAALMPFADTPRVRHAHPTKVREYLAAGCPVVATPHPELDGLSPGVTMAAGPAAFVAAIRAALAAPADREAPEYFDIKLIKYEKGQNSCKTLCDLIGVDLNELHHKEKRTKKSVSIEQMTLLEKIQRHHYIHIDDQLNGKIHLKTLVHITAPFTHKPDLQEWVKSIVYHNHRKDLHWLNEKYSINFLQEYPEIDDLPDIPTFGNGKAAVRDIYNVEDEQSVEKYETMVVDALLKKLVQTSQA